MLLRLALIAAIAAIAALAPGAVSIVIEGSQRIIRSNGLPDHQPGAFPRRGNPNSISAQSHDFRVPLAPSIAEKTTDGRGAWFGVAVNGVPFEPGTAEFWNGAREWNFEAMSGHIDLGLDEHHAHVQPTGAYHYHGLPTGLIARLGGDEKTMRLIGYAADGFPIYTARAHSDAADAGSPLKTMRPSWRLRTGTRPASPDGPGGKWDGTFTADYEYTAGSGDLDECNGRTGITPEYPAGTYYYCVTEDFPQLGRSWRGTPDASFSKHGPPPGMHGRRGPGPGFPPPPRRTES